MCGIYATIKSFCEESINKSKCNKIKHRGPDNTTYLQPNSDVFLGFHRLAIIDQSNTSNQPFHLNGLYLICNGEIYNYKELIKEHNFIMTTQSDCEVILHMYQKFGIFKTVEKLDAEFAFILYDSHNNIVYAARDPFGIRPLFVERNNNCLISFASEAKALDNPEPFLPGYYQCINIKLDIIYPPIQYYFYPTKYNTDSIETVKINIKNLIIKAVAK